MAKPQTYPPAFVLIEESLHLLKALPARAWVGYAGAMASWSLSLLLFWFYTSWFAPDKATLALIALGLALLFFALKAFQAEFCHHLLNHRTGLAIQPATWRARLAVMRKLALSQVLALALLPLAALITLPLGWLTAWTNSQLVLAHRIPEERLAGAVWEEAMRWPKQNHSALLVLSALAAVAWLNLVTLLFALPYLADRLLGIETPFSVSGWNILNTSFLVAVTTLAWMAIDPLFKAFYALRVFYGRSLATGEDIRSEFQRAKKPGSRIVVSLVMLAIVGAGTIRTDAATRPATPPPSNQTSQVPPKDADALNRRIDDVLDQAKFQWKLREKASRTADERKESWIESWFKRAGKWIGQTIDAVWKWVSRIRQWFDSLFPDRESNSGAHKGSWTSWASGARALAYVLLALVAALLVGLIVAAFRKRGQGLPMLKPRGVTLQPNLEDDDVSAAALPMDGWLALAKEKAAAGEWRLALRALYLATLARLAEDHFLVLARHKTNSDYENELRRALAPGTLRESFRHRRLQYEAVWYGRAVPDEEVVRHWLAEWEEPS